jgi:hypothetical protein
MSLSVSVRRSIAVRRYTAVRCILAAMAAWQRTLSVIVVGQLLVSVGFSFVFPFMPLYVQELGVPTSVTPRCGRPASTASRPSRSG